MTQSLVSPFQIFTDIDGDPLESGYLYVGTAGLNAETNPVAVFWDAALTVPAAQPIRTINGYPSRNGSAAVMYIAESDASMIVKNKNGSLVFSTLNQLTLSRANSNNVFFLQNGTGTIVRTVQQELGDCVKISQFGADATGATSASTAIANALAAADTVEFIGGTYLIDTNLQLASGKRLIGKDRAKFIRNTDVRLVGVNASLTALTATAAMDYGSSLITLDAASYAAVSVGDYLYVKDKTSVNADYVLDFVATSTTDLNDPSKWIYQVQTFKIVEKLGGNIVRVNAAAHVNFPLTTTGTIYKVSSTIEDVVIDGITFENGSGLSGASAEAAFINTDYIYGLTVKNCRFNLGGYTGGIYMDFGQANILNNVFDMPAQLAVFLRQNLANSVVSGNVFRNQMTGDASIFVEAHNYNVTIANNTFDGGRSQELADSAQLISAVQIEARATNCSVTGNVINGYGVGIRMDLGAINNTVSGNSISNADICGVRLNTSPLNTITGNTFYNCGIATTPGTLADVVGAYINIASDNCTFTDNIVSADSGKAKPAFYLSGVYNIISDNVFKNVSGHTIVNANNRIHGNTGDTTYITNESISQDVVRATKSATITDNVATTIFSIITPNPAGSNDGGCYACRIHFVASYGAGSAATASKGQFVMFTVANAASGTQDVSTVSTVATTTRADPGGFTDLSDPVVTLVQASAYAVEVQVQSDGTGVVGTGNVTAVIEIAWAGYSTPPVVS